MAIPDMKNKVETCIIGVNNIKIKSVFGTREKQILVSFIIISHYFSVCNIDLYYILSSC